ncbi:MAG: aromatic ring-hydroxylating oxygenase subunit alpha [Ilumatobacteraceae bacterium]|jgi:phenylpropionate dioxygenase-like ring-hydroxylating dioxygenase large terminal subunit
MTAVDNDRTVAERFPRELVRRLVNNYRHKTLDHCEAAITEPASVFTDPVRFQKELDVLFRHGAHIVGWTGELPRPGTFITKDVAGHPVLITRAEDGVLRAFRNACTHRGAQVADGCGEARRLTCPYHAWSFELNGALAGQPQSYAFEAIDKSTLGLEPLPVASVAGLIAVGLSDDVDPAAAFADIEPELRWCGYETHEIVCQHTFHLKANWKIAFDVNLETYHVDYLHRETLSNLVMHNPIYDTFGRHARWGFPTTGVEHLVDLPEDQWPAVTPASIIHTLFPSVVLLETPVSCQMFRIYPGRTVGECTVDLTEAALTPVTNDEDRAARKRGADFAALVVGKEDFPAAEQCQRGAEIGLKNFVFGANEPMLQHWHRTWNEALA